MKIVKDKTKLAVKLFIAVWIVLAVQVVLKLTFNYWQPYVIPTPQLQVISDFVDNNVWLKNILNLMPYYFTSILMILSSIQQWWFKNKKYSILISVLLVIFYCLNYLPFVNNITPIILFIILPLILNYKKWFWMLLTFILNNVFLIISLWLNNFVKTDCNGFIIDNFFLFDYYIMLGLNYMTFNLLKGINFNKIFRRKEMN